MLKPLEVYGKKFEKSFRGYDEEKVDAFLLQIAKDFEVLYEENIQLKEDAELTESKLMHYQQLEKTMQNTLMIAQTTAEEIKNRAEKEKEEIIGQARDRAAQIMAEVETTAQRRKEELEGEIQGKQGELAHVQANVQTCLDRMRNLLENQLRIIGEDDFAKEMANIVVDVELLKPKTQLVEADMFAANGDEEQEETDAVEQAEQLEVDSQAEEISDDVEAIQAENKSE